MSGISAENLAALISSDAGRLFAALEAVLFLADDLEQAAKDGTGSRSSGLIGTRVRLTIEEQIR